MWIFTKYGFYSVVCASEYKGKGKNARKVILKDTLMIRARQREHLVALVTKFCKVHPAINESSITETDNTDYRFRMIVTKSLWTSIMIELVEDIDYGNFKSEVATIPANRKSGYERALHDVWDVMFHLQHRVADLSTKRKAFYRGGFLVGTED